MLCTVMVIISMFVKHNPICVPLPPSNNRSEYNHSAPVPPQFCVPKHEEDTLGANYTSMLGQTFVDNLWGEWYQ